MRRRDGSLSLPPGILSDYLTFQRCTKSQNAYGEDVLTWADYMHGHGNVRALMGREFEAVSQRWAEARFKIRLPWVSGVQREDRILFGSPERTLDILDAEDPDGQRRELVIYAREVVE